MEAPEANSIMLKLRHLRENLEELNKKFGWPAVNVQVAGQIQRADPDTIQITIRKLPWWLQPHYGMTYKNQFGMHRPRRCLTSCGSMTLNMPLEYRALDR
ncbi:UNVERIFIED_CONTAM: hypothetical protein Sangu_1448400 [Sesamum angustifolium]|uniref:Uncharacterized protein n=1 Tax=Sesamum angustifolium TaxID=2727405 RepID=A0AAW2N8F0_9LAMI